ncbi:MAG: hypothetical protein M1839_001743 [Geoglossum umbratile]|nr:MAG: hypothetical protein M1839_001743 [Geoglossum umbratile]
MTLTTVASPQDGTPGEWFLTSDPFLKWQEGSNKLLWCSGLPGVGKTVLASVVAGHLRRQQPEPKVEGRVGVAAVYFKYDQPGQAIGHVLKSLLEQLVEGQHDIPALIKELLERRPSASLDEISAALSPFIETYSKVFLIVDAIDECTFETRHELIELLPQLSPKVHLIVTSHPPRFMEEELEDFQRVEVEANEADVKLFIDQQILKNDDLRKVVEKSPAIRDDIKKEVVKAAGATFLLARLHVESLAYAAALSAGHVRTRLQNLPTSLAEAYDDALERIENQEPDEKEIASKALAWICHAYRPLSLEELQHALAIEPFDVHLDEEHLVDGDRIIALCGGLVVADQAGVVSFVHGTAMNYFEARRHDKFPRYHTRIALSCVAYLNALKDATVQEILENYHLAKYATQYMEDHADPAETPEGSLIEAICEFLSHSNARKDLLSLLDGLDLIEYEHHCPCDMEIDTSTQAGPALVIKRRERQLRTLQLAASIGLAHVVTVLLEEASDIEALDKNTVLAAVERGFTRAVEFLVGSGGRVDLRDDHGVQVLLAITARDWHNAAEIVAKNAKSTASKDDSNVSRDQVQLLLAAYYGDDSDADRLVERGNIDFRGEGRNVGATALFLAVERNHPQMVQILLCAGVDVSSTDSMGQTALHRATRRGKEVLVRQLLWNDAEVDIKDDEGKTAWSSNAHTLNEKILGFLLGAGANPNTTGHDGVSVLYDAACAGDKDLVSYLLKSGTNPSIKTKYQWAPLHWAASNGHTECVRLLIEAGAEHSPISDQLLTPLDMAIRAGNTEIIGLLERAGAARAYDTPDEKAASIKLKDAEDAATVDAPQTDNGAKTTLAFDKPMDGRLPFGQFIYHTNTKDRCYQISHPLDTEPDFISIRYSEGRTDASEYPLPPSSFNAGDTLYEIRSPEPNYSVLEIRGKDLSATPSGTLIMRMSSAGNWEVAWEITYEEHGPKHEIPLFRATTPDWSRPEDTQGWRWVDKTGKLLARMGGGWAPHLTLEREVDTQTQDIIVACYVAKIWSDMVTIQRWYGGSSPPCNCHNHPERPSGPVPPFLCVVDEASDEDDSDVTDISDTSEPGGV